jgi:hypothetical protein
MTFVVQGHLVQIGTSKSQLLEFWQAIKAGKTFQFTMLTCRQNPKKTLRKTLKNLLWKQIEDEDTPK